MPTLIWIILATFLVSATSLFGALFFFFKERFLQKLIFPLVAFSAGSLLAGALLHLLPEALSAISRPVAVFSIVILGFAVFFLLEQFIHWHHCHKMPSEHKHPVTYLVLLSDAAHNFLDGIAIGSAFLIDVRLGLVTTLAVIFHEIPQELGDFGILIHGGWKKAKALLFNLFSGLPMVLGGILAWILSGHLDVSYLLPFAAGNFLYISASDLIPEVKHHEDFCQNSWHFLAFISGIILMYLLLFLEIA